MEVAVAQNDIFSMKAQIRKVSSVSSRLQLMDGINLIESNILTELEVSSAIASAEHSKSSLYNGSNAKYVPCEIALNANHNVVIRIQTHEINRSYGASFSCEEPKIVNIINEKAGNNEKEEPEEQKAILLVFKALTPHAHQVGGKDVLLGTIQKNIKDSEIDIPAYIAAMDNAITAVDYLALTTAVIKKFPKDEALSAIQNIAIGLSKKTLSFLLPKANVDPSVILMIHNKLTEVAIKNIDYFHGDTMIEKLNSIMKDGAIADIPNMVKVKMQYSFYIDWIDFLSISVQIAKQFDTEFALTLIDKIVIGAHRSTLKPILDLVEAKLEPITCLIEKMLPHSDMLMQSYAGAKYGHGVSEIVKNFCKNGDAVVTDPSEFIANMMKSHISIIPLMFFGVSWRVIKKFKPDLAMKIIKSIEIGDPSSTLSNALLLIVAEGGADSATLLNEKPTVEVIKDYVVAKLMPFEDTIMGWKKKFFSEADSIAGVLDSAVKGYSDPSYTKQYIKNLLGFICNGSEFIGPISFFTVSALLIAQYGGESFDMIKAISDMKQESFCFLQGVIKDGLSKEL